MLYEDYLVVDSGIRKSQKSTSFFSSLKAVNGHAIQFNLIIEGCVGEKEYRAQYESISSYVQTGNFLRCEFAYQWHHDYLQLCISGLLKVEPVDSNGVILSVDDFMRKRNSHMRTYGDWVRPAGLIHCQGESRLPTNFKNNYPVFSESLEKKSQGELVWKSRSFFR